MTDLTRKDAISILEKVDTPEETILRIKARWVQLSWRMSPQDLYDLVMELKAQKQTEVREVQKELYEKLETLVGELK